MGFRTASTDVRGDWALNSFSTRKSIYLMVVLSLDSSLRVEPSSFPKSKNELGQAEKRHGDDEMLVVRKSAGFLTICRELHDELSTVCDKSHSQGSLVKTTPKKS